MRPSRVLAKIRRDEPALFVNISFTGSPKVIELAALAGFDGVWIDHEHRMLTDEQLEHMIMACRLRDVDAMVRVRKDGYTSFFRPLETGASGIMVPHVRSLAEAQDVVRNAKFPPMGSRGFDGACADADYANTTPLEYIEFVNRETFVCVQIEDADALDHVDAIAALDGIDILFIGPSDLSLSLGCPFDQQHPRMVEACKLIEETARKHGKPLGVTVPDVPTAMHWIGRGARLVNIGSDIGNLRKALRGVVDEFRTAVSPADER